VDVIIQADGVLDFSNHNSFPVNVILRVNGRLGTPHFARILTQTSAPVYPTDVLLGAPLWATGLCKAGRSRTFSTLSRSMPRSLPPVPTFQGRRIPTW
jgi:hypothetical protein